MATLSLLNNAVIKLTVGQQLSGVPRIVTPIVKIQMNTPGLPGPSSSSSWATSNW